MNPKGQQLKDVTPPPTNKVSKINPKSLLLKNAFYVKNRPYSGADEGLRPSGTINQHELILKLLLVMVFYQRIRRITKTTVNYKRPNTSILSIRSFQNG